MVQTLPSLGNLQPILNSNFTRKHDNLRVRGQLNPPRTSATGGLELSMRLFKTAPRTRLVPGDVVIGSKGRQYILIGQGKDERNQEGQGIFKCVELDRRTVVLRTKKTTDAKTKRVNDTAYVVGLIDYTEIPLRQSEDNIRIPFNNYELLTDFPLQIGDKLRQGVIVQNRGKTRFTYEDGLNVMGFGYGESGYGDHGFAGSTEKLADVSLQFTTQYGYGETAFGEYGFGGSTLNPDYFGEKTLVVHQVENRFGTYWVKIQDA